jgi:cytolysin (calcineurin-like family phosphatase)
VTYYHYLVWLNYLVRRYGWQFWSVMRNDETAATLAQSENALSDWWMAG